MALTRATVKIVTAWEQTKTVTGLANPITQSDAFSSLVAPTISAGACNRIYFVQGAVAFGATTTINLFSITESIFNEALVPVRVYSVHLRIAGAPGQYRPGAADPLLWPLADASDILVFNSTAALSDSFAFATHTGQIVSNTVKNVRIVNTHGADALTFTVAWLLGV